MKKLVLAMSAICVFALAPQAQAGIYLEPYIGYALSGEVDDGTPPTADLGGLAYGLRAGYSILGFAFGVGYETGKMTLDGTPEEDFTPNNMGVFVGYTFPILLRAYVTYFMNAESEIDDGTGSPLTVSGTGMRVGVGYTGLPFVAINLEMVKDSYDEFEQSGVSGSMSPEVTVDAYVLSVSVPFDF